LLTALVCAWFYLAPTNLGGSTTYVVTDGISMEPHFHAGDLVLVRSQSSYRVGEIVAYHSELLHRVVLHRIIGRAGSRYVFKGDNNNFVDFEHPASGQLIGALWLHVPGVGARMQSLRSPALVGGLLALSILLFAGAAFTHQRRRRHARRRGGGEPAAGIAPRHSAEPMLGVLAIGLVALLPFVALALLAFTRPATALTPTSIPYRQSGRLTYSANATPGPAYPGDRVVTGEPLFTHVLRAVELRFDYRFRTAAQHALAGTAWLDATVTSSSGWQTTIPLAPARAFHGDHVSVRAALQLTSLLALVRRVESTTAVGGSYTLTLVPHVRAAGSVDSMPLGTTFAPQIHFSMNPLELQPALPSTASGAGATTTASPFAPSSAGSLSGRREQPQFLSLKLIRLPVATARVLALAAIALIVGAIAAALAFARTRRRDETAAIRARYGRMIVSVERVWQPPGVAVIDVSDMDALARIAEHYERSILYEAGAGGDAFWVTDESGQFRYAVGTHAVPDTADAEHGAGGIGPEPPPGVDAEQALAGDAEQPAAYWPEGQLYYQTAAYPPIAEPESGVDDGELPGDRTPAQHGATPQDDAAFDPLAREVYADELGLGWLVSASRVPSEAPAQPNGDQPTASHAQRGSD
jgi:signal peptidase I